MSTKSTKPRGKPWTADEREFVRNAYPALGPAAIAKKLKRSRSGVCALIKRMKESGEIATGESTGESVGAGVSAPPADGPDGRQDTLGRLRWVRSLLERQLYEAETTQAARLAKEYRETVEAIEEITVMAGVRPEGGYGRITCLFLSTTALQLLSSVLNFADLSNFFRDFAWGALLLLFLAVTRFDPSALWRSSAGRPPRSGRDPGDTEAATQPRPQ